MKIFIAVFLILSTLYCVPALQREITFVQNDGSTFKGYLKGDEWFSWIELPNGYIGVFNKQTKLYEYGIVETVNAVVTIKPSGIKLDISNSGKNSIPSNITPISKEILSEIWKRKRRELNP